MDSVFLVLKVIAGSVIALVFAFVFVVVYVALSLSDYLSYLEREREKRKSR